MTFAKSLLLTAVTAVFLFAATPAQAHPQCNLGWLQFLCALEWPKIAEDAPPSSGERHARETPERNPGPPSPDPGPNPGPDKDKDKGNRSGHADGTNPGGQDSNPNGHDNPGKGHGRGGKIK
jgi:hypothetical protein